MASVYYLYDDAQHTEEDIVLKYKEYEGVSKKMFFAAVKIQSTFRGYTERKMIKNWHAMATKIQKTVRGWLVRYHLPDIMNEYYDYWCISNYNEMATRIQSRWKGYTVRKQLCIGDVLQERAEIMAASENIKAQLRENPEARCDALNPSVMRKVIEALFDRHHFLRTNQEAGIFSHRDSRFWNLYQGTGNSRRVGQYKKWKTNQRDDREMSFLEAILRSIQWKDYMDKLREYYNTFSQVETEYEYTYEDKTLRRMEDLYRQRDKSRDVREDFSEKMDDRGRRLNIKPDKIPYERLLMTTGNYTLPITKVLRTEDKSKNISKQDFNLHVLKMIAKEADVPPYYINFWYAQCKIHNLPD